jgi:drug/metabolite transporter (DMT)-like permease
MGTSSAPSVVAVTTAARSARDASSELESSSSALWLGLWFVFNLLLTLSSKSIFRVYAFRFPRLLTIIHMLFTSVLSNVVSLLCSSSSSGGGGGGVGERVESLSASRWLRVVLFSAVYALNIALSNISLLFVSVSLHQVVRSLTPVFTVLVGLPFGYAVSRAKLAALLPVTLGVCIACLSADGSQSSAGGIALTVASAAISALKGVLTNRFLVDRYRLPPLELVRRMSPLALLLLLPWFYAYELDDARAFFAAGAGAAAAVGGGGAAAGAGAGAGLLGGSGGGARTAATPPHLSGELVALLVASGVGAFFLNALSFKASKHSSPLTMTVAGAAKQVTTILGGARLFGTKISGTNALGIATALGGALAYGWVGVREREQRQRHRGGVEGGGGGAADAKLRSSPKEGRGGKAASKGGAAGSFSGSGSGSVATQRQRVVELVPMGEDGQPRLRTSSNTSSDT